MRAGWTLPKARRTAMMIGAALLPSAIFAPMAPTASLAIAATCLVVFGHAVWIANLMTLPADLFRRSEVATASGFTGMTGSAGGILANLATGYVVSQFSYRPMFIWAGLMHPLSMVLLWWLLLRRKCGESQA
jgi:ACS family hexuronate transporter-like MFS transporter